MVHWQQQGWNEDLMLLSERSVTEGPTWHESNYRTI